MKVAVTDLLAFIVTTQGEVPEHPPPDQPAKTPRNPGAGVSNTLPLNTTLQVPLQLLIPAGSEDTLPLPEPALITVRV